MLHEQTFFFGDANNSISGFTRLSCSSGVDGRGGEGERGTHFFFLGLETSFPLPLRLRDDLKGLIFDGRESAIYEK